MIDGRKENCRPYFNLIRNAALGNEFRNKKGAVKMQEQLHIKLEELFRLWPKQLFLQYYNLSDQILV